MIRRDTDLTDPRIQELLISEPASRLGRSRKYSHEILNKGYELAKELRSVQKAAQLIGVNAWSLRDWVKMRDRQGRPDAYLEKRRARRTKHSIELLRRLLARADAMKEAGAPFTRACKVATMGTGVSWIYLYNIRHTGRIPGV